MFKREKKNPTILVHVKDNPVDYTLRLPVEKSSDGKYAWVTIEKETEGKIGWKVDITDRVRVNAKGESYVIAVRGSNRAVLIQIENTLFKNEPLSADEYKELIDLKIFKAHYGKLLGDIIAALKPWLLIVIVVGIIALALSGYNAYTISKLPENIQLIVPTATPVPYNPLG